MGKNDMIENVATALAGGIVTVGVNAINGYVDARILIWGFVTGVFVVSLSLLIGKLTASRL
jgi:hypothetical protein